MSSGNGIDPEGARFSQESANNPTARHDFTPHITYLKLTYPTSILYFLIMSSIKTSCLLLYRRVFSINVAYRRQFLVLMVIVWLFWLSCTLSAILNCLPFEYNWISIGDPRHCFNFNTFWMVSGAIEVFLDAVILATPIPMVLGLQLTRKRKVLVLLIFLLGILYAPRPRLLCVWPDANLPSVIITGIIRVIYGYVPGSILPSYSKSEIWSTVHVGTGIACSCLPPLRPLFFRNSSSKRSKGFSSARRRYYGIQDWKAKGGSGTGQSASRAEETVEAIPLRSQPAEPSRIKIPRSVEVWVPHEQLEAEHKQTV